MPPGTGSSIYTNLKIQGRQIRLLTIISTTPEITCQLEVADLRDGLAFNALSYVWGDPTVTKPIVVNGHELQVTTNLACALEYAPQLLSQTNGVANMKLWADAICINQDDITEKNHQVPFMRDIYSQADTVLCWLGSPSEPVFGAMDMLEIVARERRSHGADDVDHKLRDELLNLSQRIESQTNKLSEALANQSESTADEPAPASGVFGDIEAYALANSLQDLTRVISGVLQRPSEIKPTLDLSLGHLTNVVPDIESCCQRFHSLTSHPDSIDSALYSHTVGFPLALLSVRMHNFGRRLNTLVKLVSSALEASNVEWLHQYQWFYDIKIFENNVHASALGPLFMLAYWERIWILQEIVLAKRPVFACGARSLSLETLNSFAAWIRWIMTGSPLGRRGFLNEEEVQILNLEYSTYRTMLQLIFAVRRNIGFPATSCLGLEFPSLFTRSVPNIWSSSGRYYATDPKDHFYGLIALDTVNLEPDYSPDKSVGQVCQEFMVEYVRAPRKKSSSRAEGPLGLLMFAGVGHGWHSCPDMPSWGPNFPGQAGRDPYSREQSDSLRWPDPGTLVGLFESEADVRIVGCEMTVSALTLDSIKNVGPTVSDYARLEHCHQAGLPVTWAIDVAMSRPNYVAGGHPLAALHTLLHAWGNGMLGFGIEIVPLESCVGFVVFLAKCCLRTAPGEPVPEDVGMGRFYLDTLLTTIPSLQAEEENYIANLALTTIPYNDTIAETEHGFIGRFPMKVREGDVICVLNGLDQPAVLRQMGNYFAFIGTCMVAGLTRCSEIQSLVDSRGLKPERISLR